MLTVAIPKRNKLQNIIVLTPKDGTLVVQVPEKLTEEQKEALRRFDDAMNGVAPEGNEKHKKKGLFGGRL